MRKLNSRQLDRTSEILGNVSVAWFTVGVISPVFIKPKSIIDLVFFIFLGIVVGGFFFLISILLAGEIKR